MEMTSLTDVRARLHQFVARVHDEHERVMITRNGEPAAILIAPDDLESLEETLAVLADAPTVKAIQKSLVEFERGEFPALADVHADLARRRPVAE
jgi:prevent-host-death family protein